MRRMRVRRRLVSTVAGAAMTATSWATPPDWTAWVTSPTDQARRLAVTQAGGTGETGESGATGETATLTVDRRARHQRWGGVGAALTDSSVELLEASPTALRLLFDPDDEAGAALSWVRLPLSGTDFSARPWTWDWDGEVATAPTEALRAVRLLTEQVLPLRPDLQVVGAAWTAPAAAKTSGSERGGALRTSAEESYADLLLAQARSLRAAGVPLVAQTLGNEPFHASDYATMSMSTAQMARLAARLGPALRAEGVALWAGDHNWSSRAAFDELVGQAPDAFDAVAYHCYGGTPAQMAGSSLPTVVTECTGTTDTWSGTFGWDARNLVVGAVEAGSTGLMMWNLALDAEHGPVDAGSQWGCKTCRGLVTVTGPDADDVTPGPELYTLAHLSRAADPGAVHVDLDGPDGLLAVAFVNPDGGTGVVGWNGTGSTQRVRVDDGTSADGGAVEVRPGELFTWRGASWAGRTVRSRAGGEARYDLVDQRGRRHPVTDRATLRCLGGRATALGPVPRVEVRALPRARVARCR